MFQPRISGKLMRLAGGAVVGACVGSIGGAVAAALGALFGSLVGFGIGLALDAERARASKREHELDRDLGIEGGSVGAGRSLPPPLPRRRVDEDKWFA